LYNILSIKIGFNISTLVSFYHYQKLLRRTFMDKIIKWVKKKGNKKVISFSDNNNSNSSSSNRNNNNNTFSESSSVK